MAGMAARALLGLGMCLAAAAAAATAGLGSTCQRCQTIVVLFSWSWSDVEKECATLADLGYSAVQISPPQESLSASEWWSIYQPVDHYSLSSRFGDENAFKSMVNTCAQYNVGIIVDGVLNHMAAASGTGTAGDSYSGNRTFTAAGLSPDSFHHYSYNEYANCGVDDYSDAYNVQYCDLSGLPDLCTECSSTQSYLAGYVDMLAGLGVAGFRLDAAKHQAPGDLQAVLDRSSAYSSGDLYIVQEVIGAQGEAVQPSQYLGIGDVTEFSYATYLDQNIINEGKMVYLQNFGEAWGLIESDKALAFLDNWDTQRNGQAQLTYKSGDLYNYASVFALSWPYGLYRVMSSYYFTDTNAGPPSTPVHSGASVNCADGYTWVCEHRWTDIANMVRWRLVAGDADVENWQVGNNNQIAFSRNGAAFIAFNRDSYSTWYASLQTGLPAGSYCDIMGNVNDNPATTCDSPYNVGQDGTVTLAMPPFSIVAFYRQ